jgi:hypothetical protein
MQFTREVGKYVKTVIKIDGKAGTLEVGHDNRIVAVTPKHVDTPIRYPDGRIAYDAPERVPSYLKEAVNSHMDFARLDGEPYANDHLDCGEVSAEAKDRLTTLNNLYGKGDINGLFVRKVTNTEFAGTLRVKLQYGEQIYAFRIKDTTIHYRGHKSNYLKPYRF